MKIIAKTLVFAVLGGLAAIGLMDVLFAPKYTFSPTQSSDAAAWFQAIGSIVAIYVSYTTGAAQARRAHESALGLYELDRKRIEQGCRAVVHQMVREAQSVAEAATTRNAVLFRGAWLTALRPGMDISLQAFDSMPKHELGGPAAVQIAFEVRSLVAQLLKNLDEVIGMWPPTSPGDPHMGWNQVPALCAVQSMENLQQMADRALPSILGRHMKFERVAKS